MIKCVWSEENFEGNFEEILRNDEERKIEGKGEEDFPRKLRFESGVYKEFYYYKK